MRLYPKFKSNIQKGDFVSFVVNSDCLFRVLNKSNYGMWLLIYENKRAIWKFRNDVICVWGVSNE